MRLTRGGWWMALVITTLAASPAVAADKPVNLSLFPPLALVQPDDGVSVLRLIWAS